jgi:hypothetical protein
MSSTFADQWTCGLTAGGTRPPGFSGRRRLPLEPAGRDSVDIASLTETAKASTN